MACFKLATDSTYNCHRICPTSGSANACPGTATCSLVVPGLTNLAFCQASTTCQPLEQKGCPSSDQACYYGTKGAVCAPAGSVQPGGTCVNANDCAKGSTCLTIGSTGTCSSFCSTASGGKPSCSGLSTGATLCVALGVTNGEPNLGSCRNGDTIGTGGAPGSGGAGTAGTTSKGGTTGTASGGSTGTGGGSEPCLPDETINGSGNSGNFGTTGEFCFRTADTITGWSCSSITGRTLKVNNVVETCGTMPLPPKINGYYYFDASAGGVDYASIAWY